MVEEAEHMTGAILPHVPYRQWVLTLPYDLRYLLAWNAQLRSRLTSTLSVASVVQQCKGWTSRAATARHHPLPWQGGYGAFLLVPARSTA
jgi:hypothetical protein